MEEKTDESHVAAYLFVTLCGIATFALSIALGILFGAGWGWLTFAAIVAALASIVLYAALASIVLCAFNRMTGGDSLGYEDGHDFALGHEVDRTATVDVLALKGGKR